MKDFKNRFFCSWFRTAGASPIDNESRHCLPRESGDPGLQRTTPPLDPRFRGGSNLGTRCLCRGAGLFPILSFTAALAAAPAMAQVPCGPHAAILDHLAQRYGEKPHSIALTDQGSLIEVVVSPAGTWTILITQPKGPSCIVATGKQWETVAAVEPGA